jgi:hypothetical protein
MNHYIKLLGTHGTQIRRAFLDQFPVYAKGGSLWPYFYCIAGYCEQHNAVCPSPHEVNTVHPSGICMVALEDCAATKYNADPSDSMLLEAIGFSKDLLYESLMTKAKMTLHSCPKLQLIFQNSNQTDNGLWHWTNIMCSASHPSLSFSSTEAQVPTMVVSVSLRSYHYAMVDYTNRSYISSPHFSDRALFLENLNERLSVPLEQLVSNMLTRSRASRHLALLSAFQPLHLYTSLFAQATERRIDVDNRDQDIGIQQLFTASGMPVDTFGWAV